MIVSVRQGRRHTALWWRATVMKQTSKLVLDQNHNPENIQQKPFIENKNCELF